MERAPHAQPPAIEHVPRPSTVPEHPLPGSFAVKASPSRRIRVSTEAQDEPGASPERQKALIDEFYARSGASELLPFCEVESGTRKGEIRRVEVAKLLAQVQPGDVVVVVDLDRFTRDIRFAVEKVREILEKDARFISLREGEFDGTPAGEFKLDVYAAVAQLEHARIQERTEGNRKRLRSLGK
jgi:DNA invertase Pin-like site-specific DNA recombinase